MMKKAVLVVAICLAFAPQVFARGGGHGGGHSGGHGEGHSSSGTSGSHERSGYVTKNGTHVSPSVATNPNSTKADNYSTKGNVNPATGQAGTKNP